MHSLRSFYLAAKLWHKRGASHHAAALAYFLPFAIVPLLIFSITVVGVVVDKSLFTELLKSWGAIISPDFRDVLIEALRTYTPSDSYFGIPLSASLFFLVMVILTVNNFAQGLRHIWDVEPRGWWHIIMISVRAVIFLFLVQLFFISTLLLQIITPLFPVYLISYTLNQIGSFIILALVIGLGYKILSYQAPNLPACLAGGVVVAFIFSFIQSIVSWWLTVTPVDDLYGAAGLLLGFLVWIYIITAIIYYGAAYAKVFADRSS